MKTGACSNCGSAIPGSDPLIAVVRATPLERDRIFLGMTLAALLGAIALAQAEPDFCASHAALLSLAVCAGLAAFRLALRRLVGASLLCDGRWLAYHSWLLGVLIDLDGLAEVHSHQAAAGGAPGDICLCTRQRELYRLDLRHWRDDDVHDLLRALVENCPQVRLDQSTQAWLGQGRRPR